MKNIKCTQFEEKNLAKLQNLIVEVLMEKKKDDNAEKIEAKIKENLAKSPISAGKKAETEKT